METGLKKQEIKFGTSGWRGVISDDFTSENLAIVAQAIANYLNRKNSHTKTKKLLITGYDTRFMSDRFTRICAHIFKNNGISALMTERDTPTPAIAFHIIRKHALGATNITASHNPPEYNGIKYSSEYGGPAPIEITSGIEKEIAKLQKENTEIKYSAEKEGLTTFDPRPDYIKHISEIIDLDLIKKSGLKVVVDCLYGTSRGYLDYILNESDVDVKVIHNVINPDFGGASPDPSKEERLAELKNTIKRNKANLGLATDGDADRFGVVDKDGSFISANYALPLILEHLLKTRKHKGGIVRSITTTHMLDAIAKKFKREVYEVPVGFKYVGSTLFEKNAIMGCEESSGMTIFGHVPEKDGILACLLISEMIAYNKKKSIKELLRNVEKEYGMYYSNRIDATLKQEDKEKLLQGLKNYPIKEFAGIKVSNYEVLPGNNIKIELVDGSWVMIRPSGTEPIIRCYAETTNHKHLFSLEKAIKAFF